jgi:uncharacterized protein (DUF924 family)
MQSGDDFRMSEYDYEQLLSHWFAARDRNQLTVDSRMNSWFGNDPGFDADVSERYCGLVDQALKGELDHWAEQPRGRLALILLLCQFPRHIYKHSKQAFRGDRKALKLCEQGVASGDYKKLSELEQLFFFMPLQRIESLKIQQTSVKIFEALTTRVSETLRDTFDTVAQFAELRHDIIAEFGRFPHRNATLGRKNTGEEDAHLSA